MTDSRISSSLSTVARLLAGTGILLLVVSVGFSALLIWHQAIAGSGATQVLAPLWLPATFAVCSALVVFGSVALRRKLPHHAKSSARRLAGAAMLLTVAAWAICGVVWVAAGS